MDTHTDVKLIAAGLERVVAASPHSKQKVAELAGLSYEKFLKQLDGGARIDVVDFVRIAKALDVSAGELMGQIESVQVAA